MCHLWDHPFVLVDDGLVERLAASDAPGPGPRGHRPSRFQYAVPGEREGTRGLAFRSGRRKVENQFRRRLLQYLFLHGA